MTNSKKLNNSSEIGIEHRYIDADEYYDELLKMVSDISFSNQEINGIRNAIARLQAQPTADVQQVVHAHWKYGKNGVFWCSTCECIPATKSKFCPSCGAKMDGDEHDNG